MAWNDRSCIISTQVYRQHLWIHLEQLVKSQALNLNQAPKHFVMEKKKKKKKEKKTKKQNLLAVSTNKLSIWI